MGAPTGAAADRYRWDTEAHFQAFERDFGIEYRGLDQELEGVAGEEVFVGAFEED